MLDKLKNLSQEEREQYVNDHPQVIIELAKTHGMDELSTIFGVKAHVIYDVLKSVYDGLE